MGYGMDASVGVILAGGGSRRMGENKAAMLFAGEPLLRRVARRLSGVADEMLVIGPDALQALVPGVRVVPDLVASVGPLSGLYTALRSAPGARVFLVACDMPFVQPALARAMLATSAAHQDAGAVALGEGNSSQRVQPLHAAYSPASLPVVERALASDDHSLRSLLARLPLVTMDPETVRREDPRGLSAFNVNTPGDWREALRLAAEIEAAAN